MSHGSSATTGSDILNAIEASQPDVTSVTTAV